MWNFGYDLDKAALHIVHDYASLVTAGRDTTRSGLSYPFNHYAERTFLVHCRALAKFFSSENDGRDVYASHFTATPFVRTLSVWQQWSDHIDKHLMHLTKARITKPGRWTGEPNSAILAEFEQTWADFVSALRPELRGQFESEITRQVPKNH